MTNIEQAQVDLANLIRLHEGLKQRTKAVARDISRQEGRLELLLQQQAAAPAADATVPVD
jgi:hypothetical protein